MNLGVLYPRSAAYPEIALDFMDGLKTFFRKAALENDVQLHAESIGFGGSEKEVYQVTEKLLMAHQINILVLFIDLKVLPILQPLLTAQNKLALVVNPGANYPQNWIPQPNIIFVSLQHAFLCWLTGSLAARHNTNAAFAGTIYDCGYLHAAAMTKSFTRSGGAVSYNYINKQAYDEHFQLDELRSFFETDNQTNSILSVFDAAAAVCFYDRLSQFDKAANLSLFVSPMMLEQKALAKAGLGFKFSIEGYIPWLAAPDNQDNFMFTEFFIQQTKRSPNIFALLGWETGLILQEVFKQSQNLNDGELLVNQLLNITVAGPRGKMKIDPETHYLLAPVVRCVIKNGKSIMETAVITDIEKHWLSFVSEPAEGISSGWTNTYLCY